MWKIQIHPYNQEWPILYKKEAKNLLKIFRDNIISIHHIGSTAIPGMRAKPVIDILIKTKDINNIDKYNEQMIELGYYPRGESGVNGRRHFHKGLFLRTYHLHIYQYNNKQIINHLLFRDYLIKHPKEAYNYIKLKKNLIEKYPHNFKSYNEGKNAFILNIIKRAKLNTPMKNWPVYEQI